MGHWQQFVILVLLFQATITHFKKPCYILRSGQFVLAEGQMMMLLSICLNLWSNMNFHSWPF